MKEIFIPGLILLIIIALAITAISIFRTKQQEYKRTKKHPKGHYLGLGMAIGIPLGMPLGLAMGEITFGIPIGVALGVAIGAVWEKKHENELRELTPQEKEAQKKALFAGIALLIIGFAALIFYYITAVNKVDKTNTNSVSNFEECVAAGNLVMESYPRQCRHGDKTYVEKIADTTGESCTESQECRLPMDYVIRSNCPFQSACRDDKCAVICPIWQHSPNQEESISYSLTCSVDEDCDCSDWDMSNKYPCECLDGQCASVVETESDEAKTESNTE